MAWEYVDLPETGTYGYSNLFTWEQGLGMTPGTSAYLKGLSCNLGSGMLNFQHNDSQTSFSTSWGLEIVYRDSTNYASGFDVNANNVNVSSYSFAFDKCTMRFAINRETEDSAIIVIYQRDGGYNRRFTDLCNYVGDQELRRKALYDCIIGALGPTYNWQSVPSISGKNGILQFMSTIVDMNDGDPITTSDTTKFTLLEESNVGVITEDIDDSIKPGADAGGISGSGNNSGNQSTGYAFGQGESGTNVSGGGSGLYGGYKSTPSKSGGAGSGYIGNSLLSNKKMVGYNVPTSSAEGTKTESVNDVSASAVSGKPKIGNGFARIKYLDKPSYVQITSKQAAELKQTLFKIIDAKDQWTTDYRYIGCDIEPILVSQTPYVIESSKSQHSAGSYYNSAFEGDNSYVRMFLMWNQMPTVFEHQKGQPIDSHPFYDTVSGKWILMAYATWDFSSNYTDANLVSSDLPLYKFDSTGYFNYCKTRQNS